MPGVRSPECSGLMAQQAQAGAVGRSNSGMHPTADTTDVIHREGAARRVMRGVMLLRRTLLFCTSEARCVITRGRGAGREMKSKGRITTACTRPRTRCLSNFSIGLRGG
jgi:hypothetical protein